MNTDDADSFGKPNAERIGKLMLRLECQIMERSSNPTAQAGLSTGFREIDEVTGGLRPGEFVLVAGEAGVGKTGFLMGILEHFAIEKQRPVAMFSMDLNGLGVAERLLASFSRVDLRKLRSGRLFDPDYDRLASGLSFMEHAPLYVDATQALTPEQLGQRARALAEQHSLELIVVDYLQLVCGEGPIKRTEQELADISYKLGDLAKELLIPIVAPFRLPKDMKCRSSEGPQLCDLRRVGRVDHYADIVLILHRRARGSQGAVDVTVAKHPRGLTGSFKLSFLEDVAAFERYNECIQSVEKRYG